MKLGIDFGSTYSTISRYIENEDRVEALTLMEGEPASIPSAVSISSRGSVLCGSSAKVKVGRANVYEAFKMLLVEPDKKMLERRGYSKKYSPRVIAKLFLENLINGAANRYAQPGEDIDEVVICVPEVWSNNVNTLDGRNILREILTQEIDIKPRTVKNVKVITEPEAASAFFAFNYERETQQSFNGYLLLIDYGGGTLDITLTEVCSDGQRAMEIGYRESGGAGENHPDVDGNCQVGNAGYAYIQQATAIAISQSGLLAEDETLDYDTKDFKLAMIDMERLLKDPAKIVELQEYFGMFGEYDSFRYCLEDDPMLFGEIYYMGEEIDVTMQQIYITYRNTIEDVLRAELDIINKKVAEHIGTDPCSIESGRLDNFKIALVGGFSSFYLVRQQIYSIYRFDSSPENDLRVKSINSDKCEQAIALGAGLLASGRVVLQKTARYSIGLYTYNGAQKRLTYAIQYHQHVSPGVPYYLLGDRNLPDTYENRLKYGAISKNIQDFVVEFSPNPNRGFRLILKNEFRRRLESIPDGGIWCCGFSMDENDVLSFHIDPIKGIDPRYKSTVIRLDSYANMFELTGGEEVFTSGI